MYIIHNMRQKLCSSKKNTHIYKYVHEINIFEDVGNREFGNNKSHTILLHYSTLIQKLTKSY